MSKAIASTKGSAVEALQRFALAIPEDTGDEDVHDLIVARILDSETIEEVLTPATAPSLGSYVGRPIVIHDVRRRMGGQNKELGFYLLLDVEDQSTGNRAVVSSGAVNVVSQVVRANELGKLPLACKLIEVQSKTNAERTIHWLVTEDAF